MIRNIRARSKLNYSMQSPLVPKQISTLANSPLSRKFGNYHVSAFQRPSTSLAKPYVVPDR